MAKYVKIQCKFRFPLGWKEGPMVSMSPGDIMEWSDDNGLFCIVTISKEPGIFEKVKAWLQKESSGHLSLVGKFYQLRKSFTRLATR